MSVFGFGGCGFEASSAARIFSKSVEGDAAGAGVEFSLPWAMAVAMSVRADSSLSFLLTMAEIAALICSRLLLTTAEFAILAALRLSCLS